MTDLRPITPTSLVDLTPTTPSTGEPIFESVDPLTLFVDPAYQRDLGERGLRQIRKMIDGWDWSKFRAPVCAWCDNDGTDVLVVIDGQHTAIAAASHPLIKTIPVQIVEAKAQDSQAAAFIGQNVDRLGVTKLQLHHAALTAGEEHAQDVQNVCDRAGIKILSTTPKSYDPGDTVAINAIGKLVSKHSVLKARQIMEVLARAELAPVKDLHIRAAELLMTDAEYCEAFDPEDLTAGIVSAGAAAETEARVFSVAHNVPIWRALAIQWFRKTKKRRHRVEAGTKSPNLGTSPTPPTKPAQNQSAQSASIEHPTLRTPHTLPTQRNVTAGICGDPPIGRSALDQRKASA